MTSHLYDMDRIVGGLEIIKYIDPPCEVVLKMGVIEAGPDMPPEVLAPEQAQKLHDLGWKYVREPNPGYWRLKL